ncbi:hypothetical protein [Roseibacillus ishigakijimensis]|uniref:Uncharacterized protein n=1 Tax=Roseibacillus ishigakijimensis TaxID=454146 RepID=A0A934RU06_9BACT|nr:hypothetical protein [Roseibacillus ishigakijimensis]MBK1835014.1 hypothetical protein [Roseibacillus ishigakijimensis]
MNPEELELTPLEASLAATGLRFFAVSPEAYPALCAQIDESRGYPHGEGTSAVTVRGLPLPEDLATANDGSGRLLISIDGWRFTAADDVLVADAIEAGAVVELIHEDWEAMK